MEKTDFSIIIPCFNSQKHIQKCLDSISASTFENYELLIFDDASRDQSREIFKTYENRKNLRIFYSDTNLGPAKARNWLAKKAKGKYLFFLDIDTAIDQACLKEIFEKLEKEPEIGALQTKLLCPDGRIETAGHFLSFSGFPYEIGGGEQTEKFSQEFFIFGGRTAGLAVRKEIFEEICGFDQDYRLYGEDTDLCWRIWLTGAKIIYLPSAKVWHYQKSSFSPRTSFRVFFEGAKNNTSNILKNAPLTLVLQLLPLHLLAWLVVSLKLTFQKRPSSALWILKGLWWNAVNLRKTLAKRKQIDSFRKKEQIPILFGQINSLSLLKKGWRWLKNV